ncbi:hypothetical protein [Megalodesulfovibrio gigas]|uniref:Lipoprotein n=1 Tax=Megalodesulfovibrio gigas (strain ATCC 19364 / DSM 1382 / NCIMB 9332 / VKM B-1759) TaxID=1121448 RepID=T2GEJ3_MEGG1|nr:hypothetical protein [Megalodesulfovibrio gigas]AGW14342.1 hypothetical protein DGI_2611 [Megalodesulfovibrio gigas DSM 1382 = ATCC 19364]
MPLRRFRRAVLCLLAVVLTPLCMADLARAEEIIVSHTYLMGDSETKNQARAACLAEAKRAILERAGTYSRVVSEMRDFEITKDVVQSFAGAIVKATVLKEEVAMVGQSMALTCTVAGEVDMASLEAQARRMMEAKTPAASSGTGGSSGSGGGVAGIPKSLPNQPDAELLREKMGLRNDMLAEQRDATFLAANLVEKGMTFDQVARLAGDPTAQVDGPRFQCLSYGRTWVVFEHGRVACVRRALSWSARQQTECHCDGFAGDLHLR